MACRGDGELGFCVSDGILSFLYAKLESDSGGSGPLIFPYAQMESCKGDSTDLPIKKDNNSVIAFHESVLSQIQIRHHFYQLDCES